MNSFWRRQGPSIAAISIVAVFSLMGIFAITRDRAETLVVEQDQPAELLPSDVAAQPEVTEEVEQESKEEVPNNELNELIEEWTSNEVGEFGVVVQELGGESRRGEWQSTESFVSASTYKLFVSYILLQEIESGRFNYNTQTSLGRTLGDCFDSLLTYSWDICAYPMGDLVGWDNLQQRISRAGFEDTEINNYDAQGNFTGDKYTTAADEALFMSRLADGKLLGQEESEYFLDLLKNQKWRERIPAGVPENIVVADKPGWLYAYENDAAIVYGEETTYVMVVLSNNSSPERIADLSSKVYAYFHPPDSSQTE